MINPDTQPRTGASPPGFLFARRSPRNVPERTQAVGIIQIYLNARKARRGAHRGRNGHIIAAAHPRFHHTQRQKQAPAGGKTCGAFSLIDHPGGVSPSQSAAGFLPLLRLSAAILKRFLRFLAVLPLYRRYFPDISA